MPFRAWGIFALTDTHNRTVWVIVIHECIRQGAVTRLLAGHDRIVKRVRHFRNIGDGTEESSPVELQPAVFEDILPTFS